MNIFIHNVDILLFGDDSRSEENSEMFEIVQMFIILNTGFDD